MLILAAIALLLLIIQPDEQPALRPLQPARVLVSQATRTDLQPIEAVSGRLQPALRAWLRLEVDGRVAERRVEPGQPVERGQVLLQLDAKDYQDAVIQARADLQQAQQNLQRDRRLLELSTRSRQLQEQEVARLKSLKKRSLASDTQLGASQALLTQRQSDEARLQSSVATGPQQVAARQAALDRARRNLARSTLRAPFDGRINQVELEPGDYALRNQKAVDIIGASMDFYAQIRGPLARALRIGQSVSVSVDGSDYVAAVVAVQPDPDPATFTHALRLRMPAGESRPGAMAIARLPLAPIPQALVVPATAILLDEGGAFIFRVVDNRLQRTSVELGAKVAARQVVAGGLSAGDTIVIRDVAALSDGQAVIPEAAKPETSGQ